MILNIRRTITTYSYIICMHWFANFAMLRLFRDTALFRMSLLFRDADQNFGMTRKKRDGWQPHLSNALVISQWSLQSGIGITIIKSNKSPFVLYNKSSHYLRSRTLGGSSHFEWQIDWQID